MADDHDERQLTLVVIATCILTYLISRTLAKKKVQRRSKPGSEWDEVKFFSDINRAVPRQYTLIVDRSGSMSSSRWFSGSRWAEAERAVGHLAPHITKWDPDGVTCFFFSGSHKMYDNIKSSEDVKSMFKAERPSGGTNLSGVLDAAFAEHFKRGGEDETILVITDGQPNDPAATKRSIIRAANRIKRNEQLSVSFIQVGDDAGATEFLDGLDDDLVRQGAKFDIVDTVTCKEMQGLSFSQLVEKSILD